MANKIGNQKIVSLFKIVKGMPGHLRTKYLKGELTNDFDDFKDFGFFEIKSNIYIPNDS